MCYTSKTVFQPVDSLFSEFIFSISSPKSSADIFIDKDNPNHPSQVSTSRRQILEAIDPIYRKLQEHLDKETLGFPATKIGSELRILKHLFTPEQAKAALGLTYKLEPVQPIFDRVEKGAFSIEKLEAILDECAKFGVITHRVKNGVKHYGTLHYLIGMAEGGMHKGPTPEFFKAVEEYAIDGQFWDKFLHTKVSQMRTIPVEQSISTEHQIGSYDALKDLIEKSPGPFGVIPCICRSNADKAGTPCLKTHRSETCMVFNNTAKAAIGFGTIREISRDEALDILRKNAEDGLVLQPANTQEIDYMCSCCGCCCGLLKLQKMLPDPADCWTTNFYAQVDPDNCTACGACVDACQVNAVTLDDATGLAVVNLKRCLGCGNCVPNCPVEAIALKKKEAEFVPPKTAEELNEIIMTNK
jgi:Na+-translocating ferredoxin:NAD+ oxidoreductase subunit B